jgi:hypothetical protein
MGGFGVQQQTVEIEQAGGGLLGHAPSLHQDGSFSG